MPNYIPPSTPQSVYLDPREYKAQRTSQLLKKLGMLESSGGTDTDHQMVESGPQAGDTALGTYGLMPNTLEEIANRYPSDITAGLDKDQLAEKAKNDPEFAKTMAATMASYMKDKRGLSDEQTAAAWEAGHNLSPETINTLLNTPRARKFKILNQQDK